MEDTAVEPLLVEPRPFPRDKEEIASTNRVHLHLEDFLEFLKRVGRLSQDGRDPLVILLVERGVEEQLRKRVPNGTTEGDVGLSRFLHVLDLRDCARTTLN